MQFAVGDIVEGKVTGVKNFGAFVTLPDGTTGMVHISEVSTEYIQQLSDVLTDGQQVKVKIVSVSPEGKVALSIKRAMPRPERSAKEHRGPSRGQVWQPKPNQGESCALSFEEMMSRYKSQSEEKISDLRRATEGRRGGSYSRRR